MSVVPIRMEAESNSASFDDFWTLYPKRVAKRDAEKSWARIAAEDRLAAVVALAKWRRVWLARGEMQFVPHASTWLNGARWEDELPVDASPRPAAQKLAEFSTATRGEMPQEVRELIAKLKKR